ncbi:UNVERIFIED_CONTAM: hypothetical protein HHA_313940 [Hammondia hammondi]|eukprot:XP_008883525.1 hypothetical protein HHA_313940 [Hammondia hammondi]
MPFFSPQQAFFIIPSIFLWYCCLRRHPVLSPQGADGQAITDADIAENMPVTQTTTARPHKPPKTRSSRGPAPPIPNEDQIVLNPVRFGHFLHPAGEPIFLEEEDFRDSPPLTSASSSSLPRDLPGPVASASSSDDSNASPDVIHSAGANTQAHASSGETAARASLSSDDAATVKKHLPRPPVSGHVTFVQGESINSPMDASEESHFRSSLADGQGNMHSSDSNDEAGAAPRSSDYEGPDALSPPEGKGGRVGAEQESDDSTLLPAPVAEKPGTRLDMERDDPRKEPDDIFIDDPIFGDEKTYSSAGELIAVGNTSVKKQTQADDEREKQSDKSASVRDGLNPEDQEDGTAGPLGPAPNLGSPLNALDTIIKEGCVHLPAT